MCTSQVMSADLEREKDIITRQFRCHEMSGRAVVTRKPHKCYTSEREIPKGSVVFRSVVYPDNNYGFVLTKPTAYYFCGKCSDCIH